MKFKSKHCICSQKLISRCDFVTLYFIGICYDFVFKVVQMIYIQLIRTFHCLMSKFVSKSCTYIFLLKISVPLHFIYRNQVQLYLLKEIVSLSKSGIIFSTMYNRYQIKTLKTARVVLIPMTQKSLFEPFSKNCAIHIAQSILLI